MIMIALVLFLLGLILGSFVNALNWRVHEQGKERKKIDNTLSVISGRSICPKCHHELSFKDLIPVISWLFLKGKCRYCHKSISAQYPIVELSMGLIFLFSYLFWPSEPANNDQIILLATWLITSVGLMALLVYDFRWMLLPNRILYPTAAVAAVGQILYISQLDGGRTTALIDWGLSVAVASGIFWLIYYASKGKWIGYGDVRLGLVTGTVLASPSKSLLMIFVASLLGTLYVLPAITRGQKKVSARIPFGPFLILATFIVLLFGQPIIDWYLSFTIQG